MSRTFIRPETQIKTLDTFDDQKAAGSTMETTTWNMEQFLGGVISQLNRFLNTSVGGNDWYADLATPSTFEGGAQRGIDEANQDLHDLEHKRILRSVANLTDITVATSVKATGTLTGSIQFTNNYTVTIGTKTYTFQTTLTDVDGNIQIGASLAASLQNLYDAINLTGTPGTQYAASMTIHPTVTATVVAVTVTAKKGGTYSNGIATTTSGADPVWGAATLTGGSGGDVSVLQLAELPANTTAAIGSVTTLGTVCAYVSGFLTASLAEVSGSTAIAPKNMVEIVDADTRDPILDSSGRRIWGLFQSESNTDGSTLTGTTPNRAQITFVVVNDEGNDLETVDGDDMSGQDYNYASVERTYLLNLNEQDFLRGAITDVPSGATVTRQVAYDNQGVTPVNVTTHSYLDLEGAGLVWQIRDDAEAVLFEVIEGSSGGTSQVNIRSDVDEFDVDAAVNDFLQGVTMDSGGTAIDIGVTTAGAVTSAGTLQLVSTSADLDLVAGALLTFTDQYQAGSGYTTDLVLSDSSQEWDDFETAFGEVSILDAIVQAYDADQRHRAVAEVTTNIAANTLIEGANGPGSANISADLLDYRNVTFVDDVEIFINGQLMRNGVDAAANNDVYPSATATPDQQYGCFYAEFALKASPGNPDVIQMFITGAL